MRHIQAIARFHLVWNYPPFHPAISAVDKFRPSNSECQHGCVAKWFTNFLTAECAEIAEIFHVAFFICKFHVYLSSCGLTAGSIFEWPKMCFPLPISCHEVITWILRSSRRMTLFLSRLKSTAVFRLNSLPSSPQGENIANSWLPFTHWNMALSKPFHHGYQST